MNKQGIVTIAGGHPVYGMMATNLAASIRRLDKDIGITIFQSPGCIGKRVADQLELKANVDIRTLPDEAYMVNGSANYLRPKTHLYDLSPYKETIFLDADTIWLPVIRPAAIFEQLSQTPFTMANEGHIDTEKGEVNTTGFYTFWANYEDILRVYGSRIGSRLYQMRSEFIYFKKDRHVKKMFDMAKKVYDSSRVHSLKSGGKTADEFAFNIACSLTSLYPHRDKWTPAYWNFRHVKVHRTVENPNVIPSKFPLLSIGGNQQSDSILRYYNMQAEASLRTLGITGYRRVANKADILPERVKQ